MVWEPAFFPTMACPMPMPSSTDSHFVDPLGSAARQKEPWSRSKCGCVFFFSDEDRDEKLDTGNMCKDRNILYVYVII